MESPPVTKREKLLAKKQVLEAQLRQLEARERKDRHRLDTRRKVLAGAAVLAEAEGREDYGKELMVLLGRFLSRPDERALFGLPPLAAAGPELSIVQPADAPAGAADAETRAA